MNAEIIEGNKLIAEFMGWVMKAERALEKDEYGTKRGLLFESLPFDNDWNELMTVVEKIETVNPDIFFQIQRDGCYYGWPCEGGYVLEPQFVKGKTKIDATWLAVVEFIKWYNQNK